MLTFNELVKQPCFLDKLPALSKWRQSLLTGLLKNGLPSKRQEAWRYTPLTFLEKESFCVADRQTKAYSANTDLFAFADSYRLVFCDGVFQETLSTMVDSQSLKITTLNYLLKNNPDLAVKVLLESQTNSTSLMQLNKALLTDAIVIDVADGVELDKPIELIFINDQHKQDGLQLNNYYHWLKLGKHAKVKIFERYLGDGRRQWLNQVSEIHLAANSRLDYYQAQLVAEDNYHLANLTLFQQADSDCSHFYCGLGASLARVDITHHLQKPGAGCELNGLYFAHNKQHIDVRNWIEHESSACNSFVSYRGIAADKSRAIYNGKIKVAKQTKQTSAHMENHNLLLSSQAEIDSKPELEIYADDVKCSHGATVGELDQQALFYLRARGIELLQAKKLLLYGFMQSMLDKVSCEITKDYLTALLEKKFEKRSLSRVRESQCDGVSKG